MRNLLTGLTAAALLILAASAPGSLHPPLTQSAARPSAAHTLTRDADPVIVTGQHIPAFSSAPLAKLFVCDCSGGVRRQIPWQFNDIRDMRSSFITHSLACRMYSDRLRRPPTS